MVMAFDEKGQAESIEEKVHICSRAYEILKKQVKILNFTINSILHFKILNFSFADQHSYFSPLAFFTFRFKTFFR